MRSVSYYSQMVDAEILAMRLPRKPASLYEPVRYMTGLGGKRIRPVLTLMAAEMFGTEAHAAINAALAIEMFHNFTLVHDDILDNASLRRGKPTVHEKFGTGAGILSGDVMLVLAYELLCGMDREVLPEAIGLFNQTAQKVCEGQQMDMEFEARENITIAEYLEMIGKKTAALFAGSLKMGALVAGCQNADLEGIYDFGYKAGIAFQVQDDFLDTYGEQTQVGKAIGGDIASNKKTFLAVKAFELAQGDALEELKYLFSQTGIERHHKICQTISIFNALGIKKITEETRDTYFDKALEALEKINADEAGKDGLRKVAMTLINREK